MADNIILNQGSGGDTVAANDISGVKHQKMKVEYGAAGTATEVTDTTPLPTAGGDLRYCLDIAAGNISGYTNVNKFGSNPDIDSGDAPEDIWDGSGIYDYTIISGLLNLSSSSTGDTQEYIVVGLDDNYAAQQASVTASGQTPVTVSGVWSRVYRAYNNGTTDNAGDVYLWNQAGAATIGVPNTATDVKAKIQVGLNQTLMALYTVPAGKTGYLISWYAGESTAGIGTPEGTIQLKIREFGKVFRVKRQMSLIATGNTIYQEKMSVPLQIQEKSDILVTCPFMAGTNVVVDAGFDLILIDN